MHKNQLVSYHPPDKLDPTKPNAETQRTARIVDVNEKPAAVKVGMYAVKEGREVKLIGPRRRRWIPAAFVEKVVAEKAEGTVLNP